MLRISELHLLPDDSEETLRKKIAKRLSVAPADIGEIRLVRQSVDARKKDQIHLVCSVQVEVADEAAVLRRSPRGVQSAVRQEYHFPQVLRHADMPPVVAGMGPAGLFCALFLARNGIPCILLERGKNVEARTKDVERFWRTGVPDPESNVQFGEGGAGTFSDGKLTTGTHDARMTAVLDTLVAAGAPEDILYSYKPHIGTDMLREVIRALREELISLGCDIRFESRLIGLRSIGDHLTGVRVSGATGEYDVSADALVLAVGHSARDTFQMLQTAGLPMEQKPFSVGVRIEHRQESINRAQYGDLGMNLPNADYKLSCHLSSGRGVYTFCVCPGGQVIASASEPGGLVTNGMSYRARDGENCNGALLVGVRPSDFSGRDPLAGMQFQRKWEKAAFQLGGGDSFAPAQRVGDFLSCRASDAFGDVSPTYSPGVRPTDLGDCLPYAVTSSLREALPIFERKIHGFAAPDAVLTGVETRSSSPVRILRDASFQSALRGVYPCGEGCGYAGGIVSAAVDGIRVAEAIAKAK